MKSFSSSVRRARVSYSNRRRTKLSLYLRLRTASFSWLAKLLLLFVLTRSNTVCVVQYVTNESVWNYTFSISFGNIFMAVTTQFKTRMKSILKGYFSSSPWFPKLLDLQTGPIDDDSLLLLIIINHVRLLCCTLLTYKALCTVCTSCRHGKSSEKTRGTSRAIFAFLLRW